MIDEQEIKITKLELKLERLRLAAERIEQIYHRADNRQMRDMYAFESRAIMNNVRGILKEFTQ